MNPAELAAHLKQIAGDKAAYEKFLDFRDPSKFTIEKNFVDIAFKSYVHPMVACRICDYYQTHKGKKKKRMLLGNSTQSMSDAM